MNKRLENFIKKFHPLTESEIKIIYGVSYRARKSKIEEALKKFHGANKIKEHSLIVYFN